MAQHKDEAREQRIINEIVVDAYNTEERALGWYYYLEEQLQFPFHARCNHTNPISPLRRGEEVEVLKMPAEEVCDTRDVRGYRMGKPAFWCAALAVRTARCGRRNAARHRRLALLEKAKLRILVVFCASAQANEFARSG